jgi:UDP-N-acetylglucosamine acyltransferase
LSALVHQTALIAPGARLAPDVRVGPFAVVEDDTEIGSGTELLAHSVVKRYTTLGAGNSVHEGAILGGAPQDLSFLPAATHLVIGDRNRIREGVTIHRGCQPGSKTVVGSDCFLMAYAHVAHDNQIGNSVILANNVTLAGYVTIASQAFLSGGVGIHQFCRVGRLAMVGGHSKVVQDCLPFVISDGAPARARGLNVVGLRRAGLGANQLRALKEGYRLLLRSSLPLQTALERMAAVADPLVDELASFARESKRGFCSAGRGEPDV